MGTTASRPFIWRSWNEDFSQFASTIVPANSMGRSYTVSAARSCGICRTDLHLQDGVAYVPRLPHIMGHEPAGVVVRIGSDVSTIAVGDRVTPHLFVAKQECRFTRAGQHAQATHLTGILGVTLPGAFAEYFCAPAQNLLRLPDGVPFDVGGLTSCALITAVHAIRRSGVKLGDTALVLGAGGIGLVLVQLLKAAGVKALALSRSSTARGLAVEDGAAAAFDINDSTVAAVQSYLNDPDGIDCIFEMVGLSSTMALASRLVRRCGRIVVIGEEAEAVPIDTVQIAQREIEIVGTRNGGLNDAQDALRLLSAGVIRPHVAARYVLDDVNEALEFVRARGSACR